LQCPRLLLSDEHWSKLRKIQLHKTTTFAARVITHKIVGPLIETLRSAERVASGDLGHDIVMN
jgi:hypothetical protein